MTIDTLIVLTAVFIGGYLLYSPEYIWSAILFASSATLVISHHILAHFFKLYKRAWSYASVNELVAIFQAVSLTILITGIMQFTFFQTLHIRTLIVTWMLHILLIGGSRFAWRIYRDGYLKDNKEKTRTLIIGAGGAGTLVCRNIQQYKDTEMHPVAFIDDDITKQNLEVLGLPVAGGVNDIPRVVKEYEAEHIVIAIPSLKKKDLQRIYEECQKTKVKTQILPSVEGLLTGKVSVKQFRDVQVEDLLGREPVELDTDKIGKKLTGKKILVTGAGGSIGSEICRQVYKFEPATLILLGHGENSIYSIEMELKQLRGVTDIVTEIADVQDRERMFAVMEKHRPDVVYHAAAHKHVPLMERNPHEAVKNNVIGTKNTAEASEAVGVASFVMVSTDKAVNPTSVMGATKRIAEMVIQHLDMISDTKFVAVRFGNVLGSRGSVIPLFKKQIEAGGPVTVTHPDMERYFMTIPEASRLVLQAGSLAKGGEIFVLDMGEPVKIVNLARNLIHLSGFTEEEIEIVFPGKRPGEKLFEELLGDNEVHQEQIYPKIYRGKTTSVDINVINEFILEVEKQEKEMVRERALDIAHFKKGNLNQLTVT
ncbi:polysaccharide biosynthesis protein [Bacillus sp. FJAT-44742]|uniref:polysaccharide biosynthesis protein n=1 Tax=Bacillus sp. FJAT-44742 TaxID=2014005 RepID=UPI000C24F0BB|nr:nucleoside-diphosphate sugar epimerase/dehydratase [Bacillus sp. FJAT-44742]